MNKKTETQKVKIIGHQTPEAMTVLADSISALANAMKQINQSRLSRDAIVTLLARRSGVSRADIERILDNLDNFDKEWLKPEPKQ